MMQLAIFLLAAAVTQESESPWGIAPSHSASWGVGSWSKEIADTGIHWMRGFHQGEMDRVLPIIEKNGYQVAGILQWSNKKGKEHTFPSDALPEWKAYVADMIRRTKGRVRHWEVWNEPPNFSHSKSPVDYAKIVAAAYAAAKEADPTVQIGLAAQSVNLNFLAQALDAGAAGNFDYVTVHPYEVMDMVARGWEPQFLSIVPTIRKLLADKSPTKKDVPVWITEIGQPVEKGTTPEMQSDTLLKAYVLSLAQGVRRVHWFEGIDGDSGPFGLIAGNNGSAPKRLSYTSMTQLIKALGQTPRATGWMLLDGKHWGFVFEGAEGPVLATWAAPGTTAKVSFGAKVRLVQPRTGEVSEVESVELTNSPVLVAGVPAKLVSEARANVGRPIPWGGDFTGAGSVTWEAPDTAKGLHPVGHLRELVADGRDARDMSASSGQSFTVDPNFLSYTTTPIKITAVLRRNGDKAAGFNMKYESTTGWKGSGGWYTIPAGTEWTTKTWTIKDPQFVGKWGVHFGFDSDSTQHSNYSLRSVTVSKGE
jgi:polysaccharide biosynthesis protein PslG